MTKTLLLDCGSGGRASQRLINELFLEQFDNPILRTLDDDSEIEIRPEDINEQMMSDAMYTAGQKDPDFILRPSGEKRLSNFMLWQAAYSELVEMDVLWPDFTRADLDTAIEEFNHRSRRFGGI